MTDELIEIAARALFEHDCMTGEPPWVELAEHERESYRAAQRGPVAAIEDRVRAELAAELKIREQWGVMDPSDRWTSTVRPCRTKADALDLIAEEPRLTLVRRWVSDFEPAAGSSRDTTPEPCDG